MAECFDAPLDLSVKATSSEELNSSAPQDFSSDSNNSAAFPIVLNSPSMSHDSTESGPHDNKDDSPKHNPKRFKFSVQDFMTSDSRPVVATRENVSISVEQCTVLPTIPTAPMLIPYSYPSTHQSISYTTTANSLPRISSHLSQSASTPLSIATTFERKIEQHTKMYPIGPAVVPPPQDFSHMSFYANHPPIHTSPKGTTANVALPLSSAESYSDHEQNLSRSLFARQPSQNTVMVLPGPPSSVSTQHRSRSESPEDNPSIPRPFKAYSPSKFYAELFLDLDNDAEYREFRRNMLIKTANANRSNSNMRRNINTTNNNNADPEYLEKRRRNNLAAKKSRDARRQKEDELAIRCAYLERCVHRLVAENKNLHKQQAVLQSGASHTFRVA